jgi:hypothetical protein
MNPEDRHHDEEALQSRLNPPDVAPWQCAIASGGYSKRRCGRAHLPSAKSPVGLPWMWTLLYGHHENHNPTHGYKATRRAAMAASARCHAGENEMRRPRCLRTRPLPARLLIDYALQTMLLGVMRHPSSRNSLGSPGWHSPLVGNFGSIRVAFVSGQSGGRVPDRHGWRGESQPCEMPATTHP